MSKLRIFCILVGGILGVLGSVSLVLLGLDIAIMPDDPVSYTLAARVYKALQYNTFGAGILEWCVYLFPFLGIYLGWLLAQFLEDLYLRRQHREWQRIQKKHAPPT